MECVLLYIYILFVLKSYDTWIDMTEWKSTQPELIADISKFNGIEKEKKKVYRK